MLLLLTIIVSLVWWALHLMEQAYCQREFSKMLAGMLVAFAAAGVLTTYFLMSNYISFISKI